MLGKGFLNGTQGQLGFLPARNTDFIFSVVGEEIGFLGSCSIVILYFLFLSRIFKIALESKDELGNMIGIGIGIMFTIQVFINMGMTVGLAPVTGLPLPFLSAGGSSLWSALLAVGIILNIHSRRYVHFKSN